RLRNRRASTPASSAKAGARSATSADPITRVSVRSSLGYYNLGLLLLAVVLAISLVVGGVITEERRIGVFISAMLTLFILSTVELLPEGARYVGERSTA